MDKWKYGSYDFTINPNSQSSNIKFMGDNVRNLDGTYIPQPSYYREDYDVSSVFFQQRSKEKSRISIPNALFVEFYNNQFYVANKTDDRIDIYNALFGFVSSVSLSAVANKNFVGFDVQSDGYWVISDNGTTDTICKINTSGSLVASGDISKTVTASGIKLLSGYLWVLRTDGKIEKIRIADFVKVSTITLNTMNGYAGLSHDNNYLLVGNNNSYSKIYHVDISTGLVVNQITFDGILTINDITYDGKNFYVLDDSNKLQVVIGNTVDLDIHKLRNEVAGQKFVDLIDDMGISTRVATSGLTISRRFGYEHLYDVSMKIAKVNRG